MAFRSTRFLIFSLTFLLIFHILRCEDEPKKAEKDDKDEAEVEDDKEDEKYDPEKEKREEEEEKRLEEERFKKKKVYDYDDADIERLYDQWEDNDDVKLPEDEQPDFKKEVPQPDINTIDFSNPENIMKATKKGKTLMMFANMVGNPSKRETERISGLWQSSLHNGGIEVQRYVIEPSKVLFVFNDGSLAWEAKDFLITQETCKEVTIEQKAYIGKGGEKEKAEEEKKKAAEAEKKKEDEAKDGEEDGGKGTAKEAQKPKDEL
ncbi:LDLR chaperone boca-like [Lineus longissimus]|uniref:LDLR chaperone boca-like n=1 Tax=Lineus longissimus TaxID=88925 RepID=UPI002B4D947F